jgi:hypothetical protein
MKTSELVKMGVEELSSAEARKIDGGLPFLGPMVRVISYVLDKVFPGPAPAAPAPTCYGPSDPTRPSCEE